MTITPITPQQAFDNALFGVRAQGYKRSENLTSEGASCAYRSESGLKCGIGHSIPDELYHPTLDSFTEGLTSIYALLNHSSLMGASAEPPPETRRSAVAPLKELFANCPQNLLNELQGAHDDMDAYDRHAAKYDFESEMADIAGDYGLTYTAP